MTRPKRLLIANRGEIAFRIAEEAKALGMTVIAVRSDDDQYSGHLKLADEIVELGPAPARDSYLNISKIINAINATGADLVHPGYGFLSENAEFVEAVERQTKAIFVGPSAKAIRAMGDKARAKALMRKANVPLVPGYEGDDQSNKTLVKAAEKIGYPLMIKASAGGGGRGIRQVADPADFKNALESARRESLNAFGDDTILLEKLVIKAAHVEIQILADGKHVWSFGERDCSMQRRHQKVIEEAPSPRLTAKIRAEMNEAAIRAAKAVNYLNAGTVEFLLTDDGEFYFLEMNTRIQVEHPVTEEITGHPLIQYQLRIALGEELDLPSHISFDGHAIQARIYAEDPIADFTPSPGSLDLIRWPKAKGIRVDTAFHEATGRVSAFYDPMIAKLIVKGETREDAMRLLNEALNNTVLLGLKTNVNYLRHVLEIPAFVAGRATTSLLDDRMGNLAKDDSQTSTRLMALAAAFLTETDPTSAEKAIAGRSTGIALARPVYLGDERVDVLYEAMESLCWLGDQSIRVSIDLKLSAASIDGKMLPFSYVINDDQIAVAWGSASADFPIRRLTGRPAGEAENDREIIAPSHATVTSLAVTENQRIKKGDSLITIEAMKMETVITAPMDSTVDAVKVGVGDEIRKGQLLISLKDG